MIRRAKNAQRNISVHLWPAFFSIHLTNRTPCFCSDSTSNFYHHHLIAGHSDRVDSLRHPLSFRRRSSLHVERDSPIRPRERIESDRMYWRDLIDNVNRAVCSPLAEPGQGRTVQPLGMIAVRVGDAHSPPREIVLFTERPRTCSRRTPIWQSKQHR